MKFIVFLFILSTLQINANNQNKQFSQFLVNCPSGPKSYILNQNDVYYSSSNKEFLFLEKAALDTCKKEKRKIRTKKTALICTTQRDIQRLLSGKISLSVYEHNDNSCIQLAHSIPLKIIQHFPFNFYVSYYKVHYKNKIFYISSYEIHTNKMHRLPRKHFAKKRKKHHKKRKNTIKHTKHLLKNLNKHSNKTKKYNSIAKENVSTDSIKKVVHNIPILASDKNTTIVTDKPSKIIQQKYTYRCVAEYGTNRITAEDEHSMSDASDALWKRCQSLKLDDEICLIKDCYKLIIN